MRRTINVKKAERNKRDCCPHCGSINFRTEWRPAVRCLRCHRVWFLGDLLLELKIAAMLAHSEKLVRELELSRPLISR